MSCVGCLHTFVFVHIVLAVDVHLPIGIDRYAYLTDVGIDFASLKSVKKTYLGLANVLE